jgi:hypothetical protein
MPLLSNVHYKQSRIQYARASGYSTFDSISLIEHYSNDAHILHLLASPSLPERDLLTGAYFAIMNSPVSFGETGAYQ